MWENSSIERVAKEPRNTIQDSQLGKLFEENLRLLVGEGTHDAVLLCFELGFAEREFRTKRKQIPLSKRCRQQSFK